MLLCTCKSQLLERLRKEGLLSPGVTSHSTQPSKASIKIRKPLTEGKVAAAGCYYEHFIFQQFELNAIGR